MFSTNGQEVKGGTPKSLQPGVVFAHINSGTLKTSTKGDKKVLELYLEGPALDNFEGWPLDKNNPEGPKYKGQTARVTATSWTDQFNNPNITTNEIMYKLSFIAKELGIKDKLDAVQANSIEEWVEKAISLMKGQKLYFFLKGSEEEYNDKTFVKLSLPKYKFCSADESKLDKFDKANKYHYKPLDVKSVERFEAVNNDFDI